MKNIFPTFKRFLQDLTKVCGRTLGIGIGLSALNGLTGALGILLVVPLLSAAGIGEETLFPAMRNLFAFLPEALRLVVILIVYIALIALQSVISRKSRIFEYRLSGGFAASLRKRYFGAALEARWESHLSRKKTDLHSGLVMEIERISYGALNLLKMIGQSFVALVQFAIVFAISPLLTALVSVGGILFFLCTLPWNIAARKMGQKMVNLNRSLHASLADKIGGIKEAKIYGAESFMERDFGAVCEALKDNVAGIAEIQTRPDFLYRLGSAFLVSLFLYVGIEVAKLSIPVLLIQVFVFARLWPLFSSFQTGFQQLVTMLPSYESFEGQIAEFRAEAETKPNSDEEIRLDESLKAVGLAFSYAGGGDFSLEGVDIELPARSFCALIGSSGAGKSTLADLLCGLLVPTGGEIFVDGKKIGVEERGQWRRSLSYVPQDPYLLHGTVRENLLAFLPEVEEQTLHECLSLAAAEFVYSLPQGLDTLVGDRGVKLSGGERQRIVLARALLRNPSFLVLDEATSALDSENDAKIQRAVTELSRRMTILVIAHRLSTVRKADAIFVVEGGKIVKKGTYASLALFESS